jgi:hypothetical protein
MRSKPYRNERIVEVLQSLFFVGGPLSYANRYAHKFPEVTGPDGVAAHEVPICMVALVATAVRVTYELGLHTNIKTQLYAAIDEWRTGKHEPTNFSADRYLEPYDGHVYNLEYIRTTKPTAFHTMMAHLYTHARYVTEMRCHTTADQLLQWEG